MSREQRQAHHAGDRSEHEQEGRMLWKVFLSELAESEAPLAKRR